ncbi:3-deoxy-manno-octulosonate cytidylyltransferase [Natronospirillum operosum]|uniref:3-deoxy-manno-octulosonate cytidylyltransferase n=1 Tax=Natronospirillum operosum TaxID=2759953 RepID=A0A4Z0WJ99_9GAMM|nr:3-deoxy-manno-octulosonate cytidylyltransferase [Natronospirillum operosum]TGG95583.1 3-deoxy-manno-octulosonate cytidylyltransferase [Natronospirillum operosum]
MTANLPAFKVVIPARYASSRLPGKPLADIHGRPMIAWVADAARRSQAEEVWVATDDPRIESALQAIELPVVMTAADHESGTDRLAEVARLRGWSDDTIVVNVQGDEPGMPPTLINQVAALLAAHPEAGVASLCTPIETLTEYRNPNAVKVVTAGNGLALYFSRASVPYLRDSADTVPDLARRHLGIYAYRAGALQAFTGWSPSPLEQTEKLEQLRFMEHGVAIAMAEACEPPPSGVDTPEDLEQIRGLLKGGVV